MAKYDQGGGCACGLYKVCECKWSNPLLFVSEDCWRMVTDQIEYDENLAKELVNEGFATIHTIELTPRGKELAGIYEDT